jgi:hypothetical protein
VSDLEPLLPLRIVKIQVFQVGEWNRDAFLDKIIQPLRQRYEDVVRRDGVLEVYIDRVLCQFRMEDLDNFLVLISTIKYYHDYELKKVIDNDLQFFDLSNFIPSLPPSNLLSTFTIFIPLTWDENLTTALVEQYSEYLSKPKIGIGIIRGCLLSIFESGTKEEEKFNRYYFLSPLRLPSNVAEKRVEEILGDIRHLAVYMAELSKLHSSCKNFFSALESGEGEIREKIESFLWKLIGPEPVKLETLESWLSYIMERESTISAMIATMQVNHIEAKSILSKVEILFKKLNERSFEDYPMNSEMEIEAYNRIVKPFENYIVRSEALKTRLGTAMEEVRTYLSLQQQKITLEEQKASKEQLVRLVNLQEILHKLEILIVAVYLTEMAKTVFEALIEESANLLTVAFIPFSLLISILLSRMLHKTH